MKQAFDTIRYDSLDTIHRLSIAAEYRDPETGAHIQRMSRYSAAIAHELGLDKQTVESILTASPMHDVGKIGVPDGILMKPQRLTPEEWEVMKEHTTIGGRILGKSRKAFIQLSAEIALTHHEKWDGSGYPNGLKGKKIPLSGRIVALADVFDALTSSRPYKEAFSVETAFDIIKKSKGTHFDPDIVKAFFNIEKQILKIKNDDHTNSQQWQNR